MNVASRPIRTLIFAASKWKNRLEKVMFQMQRNVYYYWSNCVDLAGVEIQASKKHDPARVSWILRQTLMLLFGNGPQARVCTCVCARRGVFHSFVVESKIFISHTWCWVEWVVWNSMKESQRLRRRLKQGGGVGGWLYLLCLYIREFQEWTESRQELPALRSWTWMCSVIDG